MERFTDVVVSPFTELLDVQWGGSEHRGGPLWPDWASQTSARHCQGGVPIDEEPDPTEPATTIEGALAWGGPITRHFGHQMVDFSMRLLPTVDAAPGTTIVFATHPRESIGSLEAAPPFFALILDWLGIPQHATLLIQQPTLVRELIVLPQAEQHYGPGPTDAHLDRLDRLTSQQLPSLERVDAVYVSRAGQHARFAGEQYMEDAFRSAGATVVRPEALTLAEQLRTYAAADLLVFAEGSALHAPNLLGRALGDVVVINRRAGKTRAVESLTPRARSVTYLDTVGGVIHGLRPSGAPAIEAGLTTLDLGPLVAGISGFIRGFEKHIDVRLFLDNQARDALLWLADKRTLGISRQPGSTDFLLRTLREAGLGHLGQRAEQDLRAATRPFASKPA